MFSKNQNSIIQQKAKNDKSGDPLWFRYAAGAAGDMVATCFTHPFDTVKVRCQLQGEVMRRTQGKVPSIFNIFKGVVAKDGVINGLYAGFSASMGRQFLFSGLRHGNTGALMYFMNKNQQNNGVAKTALNMHQLIVCASISGLTAAAVANPMDVVLIRMQSDGHIKDRAMRRNYAHALDGLKKVVQWEGVRTLWQGCWPTCVRAMICTTTQLPVYFTTKQYLAESQGWDRDSIGTHLTASIFSASAAALATCPVDVVKTRVINSSSATAVIRKSAVSLKNTLRRSPPMAVGSTRSATTISSSIMAGPVYNGAIDCVKKTFRGEGIRGFYRGLTPTLMRLTPHTIILWLSQEQILMALRNNF